MPRYSIADYADRVGVSRAYLYKLAKQKKIDFILNGKKKEIDPEQADSVVKYKPAHRATPKTYQANGAKRKDKPLGPEAATGKKIEFNKDTDRSELERALLYEKTKKERIANEKTERELVRLDAIIRKVFSILRPLRDDIQAIAKRVSGLAYTAESKHEAEKIITKETDRILLSRIGGEYIYDAALKKKIIAMLMK